MPLRSWAVATLVALTACSGTSAGPAPVAERDRTPSQRAEPTPTATHTPRFIPPINHWVTKRPTWLGHRVLPKRPDGFGVIRPTPPLLRNRRLATMDLLPPPNDKKFHYSISKVPAEVVARSSFRKKCPVTLDELAYLNMTFWGFDHLSHTGEMIVNRSVADDVVSVFQSLFAAHFPIEEMRVVTLQEQRDPPYGDTNLTSSFECRPATGGSNWSEHAYGLAIDINPFHNPYVRGDLVLPERALAYADRGWVRPGMIFEGDVVTNAFDSIGWGWGGRWNSLKDYMHFSQNGR
ncbi:MAG TPA: M15 family metallopeptidase [Actinomycetota bacterium]|nr:M15 family metallopeptidase [Actinomycetota bacterium]